MICSLVLATIYFLYHFYDNILSIFKFSRHSPASDLKISLRWGVSAVNTDFRKPPKAPFVIGRFFFRLKIWSDFRAPNGCTWHTEAWHLFSFPNAAPYHCMVAFCRFWKVLSTVKDNRIYFNKMLLLMMC